LPDLRYEFFSSLTNENIDGLKKLIWEALQD